MDVDYWQFKVIEPSKIMAVFENTTTQRIHNLALLGVEYPKMEY